jgi:hypothetical protein
MSFVVSGCAEAINQSLSLRVGLPRVSRGQENFFVMSLSLEPRPDSQRQLKKNELGFLRLTSRCHGNCCPPPGDAAAAHLSRALPRGARVSGV